jgi:hypothetical protein
MNKSKRENAEPTIIEAEPACSLRSAAYLSCSPDLARPASDSARDQ